MFGLVVGVEKRVSFVWGVKLSGEGDHAFMLAVSSQMVVVRLWMTYTLHNVKLGSTSLS